jgi:hypothetical protein
MSSREQSFGTSAQTISAVEVNQIDRQVEAVPTSS